MRPCASSKDWQREGQSLGRPSNIPRSPILNRVTKWKATPHDGWSEIQCVLHRGIVGHIKAMMVKRDRVGRLWLVFRVFEKRVFGESSTRKSGGFDLA
jgi:hypothetical protein